MGYNDHNNVKYYYYYSNCSMDESLPRVRRVAVTCCHNVAIATLLQHGIIYVLLFVFFSSLFVPAELSVVVLLFV